MWEQKGLDHPNYLQMDTCIVRPDSNHPEFSIFATEVLRSYRIFYLA